MKKIWIFVLLISLPFSGCISVSATTDTPTPPPQFVTSTLPPTKSLVLPPTNTPLTPVTGSETPTPAVTEPANCKVRAVLLEDVTIPDETILGAGETFTKIWRFKNTGTCNWIGFTINFLTGDRMGAPDSAPIADTVAGSTVDVSLDLTAPGSDGTYSGYFTLKDDEGESLNVGIEKTFWLKIIVEGEGQAATSTPEESSSNSSNAVTDCDFTRNSGYVTQIESLINNEREKNGLPTLSINSQLITAAQDHAADMACNDLLSHTGSDGSFIDVRLDEAGYSASYYEEIIFGSGTPQQAFDWWMEDKPHRDAILGTDAVEMGIGYAYSASSTYGDYYTVDFASP